MELESTIWVINTYIFFHGCKIDQWHVYFSYRLLTALWSYMLILAEYLKYKDDIVFLGVTLKYIYRFYGLPIKK